jgi:hypothetical protein
VQWTTGRPRTAFTGTTGNAGTHSHGFDVHKSSGSGGVTWDAANKSGQHNRTEDAGDHTHTVTINGGGDTETAPDHVVLGYLIKAIDHGVRLRPDMTTGVPV